MACGIWVIRPASRALRGCINYMHGEDICNSYGYGVGTGLVVSFLNSPQLYIFWFNRVGMDLVIFFPNSPQ